MKKSIILFALLAGIFLISCQKTYETKELPAVDEVNSSMELLKIDNSFNWKMTKEVRFLVSGKNGTILRITSPDETLVYHKARLGAEEAYPIDLSFPADVDHVAVNGQIVNLTGEQVSVQLAETKSVLATTVLSLHFDGSSDYIYINDGNLSGTMPAANTGAASDFTISSWIYLQSTAGRKPIASKQGTSVGGNARGFLFSATDGGLEFEVFKNDSDDTDLLSASGLMSTNTWYHVEATYDFVSDGSSIMKLYIDGSLVASTATADGPVQSNPQPFDVGRYYYSVGYSKYFHGYMDDFRVYSYARTEVEIAGDMTDPPSGSETDLELSWLFEEGPDATVGVTATDETANANDGNIVGCIYSDTTVPYIIIDSDSDGVPDDEDDYPNDPDRAFDNYFPAAGYGSLAFEDLWPGKGDYDFNDLVIDYRFQTVTNASNAVVEIFASFPVKASGAFLQNGFGFSLPDASPAFTGNPQKLDVSGYDVQESYIGLNAYGHESGQTHPTIVVVDRVFNVLPEQPGEIGVNTDPDGNFVDFETITITLEPNGVFSMANFSLSTWNPFLIVNMDREHEVHLPDYGPTDLMNTSLFGQWEDDSDEASGRYFKSVINLPWALNIPSAFEWPEEKKEITAAYLHFAEWAESGGTLFTDWYSNTDAGYRNDALIYDVP